MRQLIVVASLALIAVAVMFFIRDPQVQDDTAEAMPRAWWHE